MVSPRLVAKIEAEEREFIEWDKGKRVTFSNLKPSVKTISRRLPAQQLCKSGQSLDSGPFPFYKNSVTGQRPHQFQWPAIVSAGH